MPSSDDQPERDQPADAGGDSHAPEERAGSAHVAWRAARRVAYGIGGLVALVVVGVAVALLLLQTEWGAGVAKGLILSQVNPLGTEAHPARLEIDDLDGNWISTLQVRGARLVRPASGSNATGNAPDSVQMAQIDSLEAGYDLLGLLSGEVRLGRVGVYGPEVRLAQQPDSTWDLLNAFLSDTTATDTSGGFRVLLDRVEVRRGRLDAQFYTASGADSTLRVRGLTVAAGDLAFGGEGPPRADVRTFAAQFTPPGQTLQRRLAASAWLAERRFTLRNLNLESPYSNVSGKGALLLPSFQDGTGNAPVRDVDFSLRADPLSFRDLAGFVPDVDPSKSVRFELGVAGTSERLRPSFEATFSGGGTARLGGTVQTGLGGGPLGADLDGQVRGFDPGFLATGPPAGAVNADLSADLRGPSAEALEGTTRVALFDTRYGAYRLDRTTLEARFDGAGTVALDAQTGLAGGASVAAEGTVQPFGDTLAYDLGARFRNVDLGRFAEGQSSDLDGQLSVQGYGTSPADANATVGLTLDGSRVNQFAIEEGRFTARLLDGSLDLGARVRSPEGNATVDGRVALTADPLRYQISEGRVEDLDVAALTGDTTRSSITGTVRLDGRGTDPQGDLRLDVASLQLTNSYYGPYVINSTNLDATVAGGRVALSGQADLDGGAFELSDTAVEPFGATPTFRVGNASFQNVDIGALGQYPAADSVAGGNAGSSGAGSSSDLNGSVSLSVQGFDPQTMHLAGTARLDSSRLNRQPIESAAVEITLRDGRLAYEGALDVPEGRARIAGTVRPFSENPSFEVTEGTFSGLDAGALAGIDGLETNLQGEVVRLEGTGFSPAELRGNARIDLSGSQINASTITRGTLDLDAREGVTDVVADFAFADGGRADFQTRIDQTGEALSYRAEGTVDRLDVGRLAGGLAGDTTRAGLLSLTLDVRGEGTDPRTARSQGRVALTGARVAGIEARRALLEYHLHAGRLTVDTLALRSNVGDATGGGVLALYDAGAQEYATDVRLTAHVDSLAPVRPFLSDSLGALALQENRFRGRLTSRPGGPLRLEADASFTGLVYGETRVSRFDGTVSAATAPARDSTGASGLLPAAEMIAARGVDALTDAQARGEAGYLSSGGVEVRRTGFNVAYGGDEVGLQLRVKIDNERDVELAGVLDPRPEGQRVRLDTLNVRFGPDRWQLLQDATISYGDQYRVSSLLLFTEDGQQIAADGVIDLDGQQNFVFTLEAFRIGAVADLFDYRDLDGTASGALTLTGPASSPELEGTLAVDVESRGRRTGGLRVALDYARQRLGVDATLENEDQSTLTAEGYLPLDLRLTMLGDTTATGALPDSAAAGAAANPADSAATDSVAVGEDDSPVDIRAVSRGALGPEEIAFAVRADSFSIGWARPFLSREQVEGIGGRLSADVDVGGTFETPEIEGAATLTDGAFDLAAVGTAYEDVRARLRFTDEQVQVEEIVARSGGGRLTAGGSIGLQGLVPGALDLAIEADEFRIVDTDAYGATVTADLNLQGTAEAPDLHGDVRVRNADLYLDALTGGGGDYAEVNLSDEDLRTLRENFGVDVTAADTTQSALYQALAMSLDIEIERDTWLRSTANPELDVQLEGEIDLEKAAQEDPQLFGTIEVVPERSRVVQFGKRFEIASGRVTFNGDPTVPLIDFAAEYNVAARRSTGNEVTITLSVRGRPDDLEFELGSDPSMATTDIVSYIATGRPAGARSGVGGGGGGATELATGAALGQLTNLVEGLAGAQGAGLDVIEIQNDPQRGTILTAGEYVYTRALANPFFVAVSQPLSTSGSNVGDDENQTEVTLQYEVTEGFLVRLLRRESIRLNLRYEYAY